MAEFTIAAGMARALVDLAVANGASRAVLLERARIEPAELRHQDDRIPFEKYMVLMRAARELSRDPALALHFGEAFDLSEMSIVGLLDYGAGTMADAIAQLNRYASLVADIGGSRTGRFVLERHAREVWVVDTRPDPNAFPEATESTFARIVCQSRRSLGESDALKAVHVTHPAAEYRAEYERVFRVPIVFGSDCNALVYHASRWERRITTRSPYVSDILGAHAERLLLDLEQATTMRGRVERVLVSSMDGGDTSMKAVAASLRLTRPTLLRRLKVEGVTFAQVLDELRRTIALDCLRGGRLSVTDTAYRLGFSDPAPFSRAFKRWTGKSPRAFVAATQGERKRRER